MKWDDELLAELLKKIGGSDKVSWRELVDPKNDVEADRVLKHIDVLFEKGLVKGIRVPLHGHILWQDLELTYDGFKALEAERHATGTPISLAEIDIAGLTGLELNNQIFVVHGHDEEMKQSVARFIERLGLEVIILSERPNGGRTIIEKFEHNSDVGFVIVLLSPDDEGGKKGEETSPRARQNVILELGYFIGKLGRNRVCALKRHDVDIPSDILGVVYETYDASGGWKFSLIRELREAGYKIDASRI
jgi:predicted nucleotide-binding protein